MNAAFANLESEKQERVIAACLEEFASNGYAQASTNNMVRAADISKGLLFHYFGNKQQLFLYLSRRITERYIAWFFDGIGELHPDLLERTMQWTLHKLQLFRQHPLVYRFAFCMTDQQLPPEVQVELAKLQSETAQDLMERFLAGVDWSGLRPTVNQDKAVRLIVTVLEGQAEQFIRRYQRTEDHGEGEFDRIESELRELLSYLRDGLCGH